MKPQQFPLRNPVWLAVAVCARAPLRTQPLHARIGVVMVNGQTYEGDIDEKIPTFVVVTAKVFVRGARTRRRQSPRSSKSGSGTRARSPTDSARSKQARRRCAARCRGVTSAQGSRTLAGRPSSKGRKAPGGRDLRSPGPALDLRGETDDADRWFARAAELAAASQHWIGSVSALAYRSVIAGEQGRRDEQMLLSDQAVRLAQERGVEAVEGEVSIASGLSIAAGGRLEEALPLLERGVIDLRSCGQPIDLAYALICYASVLRTLGDKGLCRHDRRSTGDARLPL